MTLIMAMLPVVKQSNDAIWSTILVAVVIFVMEFVLFVLAKVMTMIVMTFMH